MFGHLFLCVALAFQLLDPPRYCSLFIVHFLRAAFLSLGRHRLATELQVSVVSSAALVSRPVYGQKLRLRILNLKPFTELFSDFLLFLIINSDCGRLKSVDLHARSQI